MAVDISESRAGEGIRAISMRLHVEVMAISADSLSECHPPLSVIIFITSSGRRFLGPLIR